MLHHEVDVLPNGNLLVLGAEKRLIKGYYTSERDPDAPRKDQWVMGDRVFEIGKDGRVVWQWNAFEHLDPMRIGYETLSRYWIARGFPDTYDWSHGNGIAYDAGDDSLLLSFRYQAAIVKIDKATGRIHWILGDPAGWRGRYEGLLLKPLGEVSWFYHQHGPDITDQGSVLVYDNGNYGALPFDPPRLSQFSRAVEYRIDEENRTVTPLWQSTGGERDSVLTIAMGDIDHLPQTGNRLVHYGMLRRQGKAWSRIREYSAGTSATVVWEATIENRDPSSKLGWASFGGERLKALLPVD